MTKQADNSNDDSGQRRIYCLRSHHIADHRMKPLTQSARYILKHPFGFILLTLKGFRRNQGVLLAGAIAYYALLSIIPFLILTVMALSNLVDQAELLHTLKHYLEWLIPNQSAALLADLDRFLDNGVTIGIVLLATILFFSSQAFSVLEKSMAVVFSHRHANRKRHFLTSALLPYLLVFCLGAGLLAITIISISLQSMALMSIDFLDWHWSLDGLSRVLFYLLGLTAQTITLAAIYLLVPVGRTAIHHALIAGLFAASLWEVIRHLLVWHYTDLSKASVVYGSLSTAVIALFSMEIIATLILLGAQFIAEYERLNESSINHHNEFSA